MPFIKQKGIDGLVWVPEETDASTKKHDCPDCEHCNNCADNRCRLCRYDLFAGHLDSNSFWTRP